MRNNSRRSLLRWLKGGHFPNVLTGLSRGNLVALYHDGDRTG